MAKFMRPQNIDVGGKPESRLLLKMALRAALNHATIHVFSQVSFGAAVFTQIVAAP